MTEIKICLNCKNCVDQTGGPLGSTADRAYCARRVDASTNQPEACEVQRFAVADKENGICGQEAIFWEPCK